MVSNIYGVDIAFHEGGLNYGSRRTTSERIIKKMVRTAMLIHGFFNVSEGQIIFASPKINKAIYIPLAAAIKDLNYVLQQLGLNCSFILYANHEFREAIFEPVIHSSASFADTSELFLRSMQMYNLFSSAAMPKSADIEISATTTERSLAENGAQEDTAEIKIGELVRSEIKRLIAQNLISNEQIKWLLDKNYCKDTFDINYPLLKMVGNDVPVTQQRQINGYSRYWKEVYIINGVKFLLCSQWYNRNLVKFKNWLNHN
ncbi:hypothetical protein CVD25_22815 [Bacillus canaveralius]|uniref:Uncharacterized protein n=1 Tax=Bacillus canaveralius TaxID=1403243 RepID=A0A2N5GGD2_9BACI|nr:hypothetical protein [Bacillus canaveralius]PLR79791.1 hypothetical protein CU635_21165 [Bacillus canaveralius]PLR88290.1 hypothetical protein CVD25_22815 [Bacillus canaveralius]